jgi:hypothetical protein
MAYEITEQVLKDIKHHASRGLTRRQIAAAMGWSHQTLYDKIKENTDVIDAIKSGESSGIAEIANALFENAKNGNVTAQIFFLKNRSPEVFKDRVPEGAESDRPTPQTVRVEIVSAKADTTAG